MDELLKAYRGEDKYIFVSYAHRDSADVYPAIKALKAQGFRVWYDEGIEAGSDWAKSIGTALEKASQVLYFASPVSVKSENCQREISFAKEHDIPVLTVLMGSFKMPEALQQMLFVNQGVQLGSFRTYGDFVKSVAPALEKRGVDGAAVLSDEDAAKILAEPVVFASRKKRTKGLLTALIVLAVLAAIGFGAYSMLFRQVPAVVGLLGEDAQTAVETAGFDCNVSLNYSDEYDYGVVFAQSAEGSTFRYIPVVLTQSLGPEEDLTDVPDTVGKHISDAASLLVKAGMTKFTVLPQLTDVMEKAHVTSQSIPAGLRVSKANIIDLDVATDGGDITFTVDGREVTISGTDAVTIDIDALPEPEPEIEPEPEPEPEPVDEYGMTEAERAIFDSVYYIANSYDNSDPPQKLNPYVDAEKLRKDPKPGGVYYLARSMTLEGEPEWYAEAADYSEYIIASGATVTIEGDWTHKIAFTVSRGGMLIVNGSLPFEIASNQGTLIVNGRLYYSSPGDPWYKYGRFANNGRLAVNGSFSATELWTFPSGSESGNISADERFDRTDLSCPFTYTNGPYGFNMFTLCYTDPENAKKWW